MQIREMNLIFLPVCFALGSLGLMYQEPLSAWERDPLPNENPIQ